MTNTKDLLLIFTRNPVLGKCKTRLAASIGDQNALDIYKFLLMHTQKITKELGVAKQVCYSDYLGENDIWDIPGYDKAVQIGEGLGERMANAFQDGFKQGHKKIIIIGSDMYDLQEEDLKKAFTALETYDYVIGPALDGGYYLLGMNTFNAILFEEKPWGTDTVLEKTLMDLNTEKYYLLAPKNDIDDHEDVKDLEVFRPFLR